MSLQALDFFFLIFLFSFSFHLFFVKIPNFFNTKKKKKDLDLPIAGRVSA
jgi:hypothetical protein